MPSQADRVELLIGGKAHGDWESYSVDSELRTPADGWHVTLGLKNGSLPASVVEGALVEVRVGGERAMVGRIDDVDKVISHQEHTVSLTGRDGAAVLVDCSAPIFVARQASLEEIVAKVVKPLGITKIRIDAATTTVREKVNVEPGDSAWEVLRNAAEANGLWPWFAPDGTLIIGGPDYKTAPVATLILRRDGKGNNVRHRSLKKSVHGRFSEVTVLGQTHGTAKESGKNNLKATVKDTGVTWYRPKVVVDHEADSQAICRDRARKLLADSRLEGWTYTAEVKGHRIVAPGQPADGKLWTPGQRVFIKDEDEGLDGIYFIMGRKFLGGRSSGQITELTIKEDGVWVLDAHPHRRKHRRGKNDSGIMQDYTGPSS
ncbi:phage baseplate assembly protein [uncultured Aquitalea sp.]|uniref:phage baseplate assembly protein n=1 Tax=uncultured Aquitalea sp. TaxID=540272 RepID=UPI0025F0067E|nr:phage tail protein [uncultured Aquitalea sp.]